MALKPTIKACSVEDCTKLRVTDTTGAYNDPDNLTGWGSPNIDADDAGFVATITVNGTEFTVTDEVPSTVTGDFTFDDITVSLPDGWNTITYTLDTTATDPVSVTIKIFTYCKIKCCVFNKMLEMNDFDICKDSERIASLMHMWNLYNSMLYSANGCSETQATEILTRLQQLCEVDDTTSGCGCS